MILAQKELHMYGSSRIGIYNVNIDVTNTAIISPTTIFTRGNKFFELSNHLGNVLVTVSDKKIQHSSNNSSNEYYLADVVTANDYYPFGMAMPGRQYTQPNSSYRYGFNGKENDKDISEGGQDYGLRIYDARVGRFYSVDPVFKEYPWNSTYAFAENDVIRSIDLDGLEKHVVSNYYNKEGVLTRTVVGMVNNTKTKELVNMQLLRANSRITTNVLVRNVQDYGDHRTTYEGRGSLNPSEQNVLDKGEKLNSPSISGRGLTVGGPKNDKGEKLSSIITNWPSQFKLEVKSMEYDSKSPSAPTNPPTPPITETFKSGIEFTPSAARTWGDPDAEIKAVASLVNGKDYSITIFGNFDGTQSESFSTGANFLARGLGYKTYGDLAIARAEKIKKLLVDKGLNPSKIKTKLGNPQGGMNASYNITTTEKKP